MITKEAAGRWVMLLVLGVAACDQAPDRRPESVANSRCNMPAQTTAILQRDFPIIFGAVIDEKDADLATIVRIDRAGRIQHRNSVF